MVSIMTRPPSMRMMMSVWSAPRGQGAPGGWCFLLNIGMAIVSVVIVVVIVIIVVIISVVMLVVCY